MVLGCIDIGSNTTRLLVADGSGELASDKAFTRIGAAVGPDGTIPAEKIAEVAEIVATQVAVAASVNTQRLVGVATAVVRHAPNRDELVAAVRQAADLEVDVLSGEREAQLSFLGATRGLDRGSGSAVAVVDVGGGSTEVAVGTPGAPPRWSRSVRIGSGALARAHVRCDPPSADELHAMRAEAIALFDEDFGAPRAESAHAVGGTATSLRRLVGDRLTVEALRRGVELLCHAPAEEVAAEFGLVPDRVRLLPGGITVLAAVCERLACPVLVADGGLREGVLAELAG